MVTECIGGAGGGGGGVAHVSSSDRQEYVIYSWMTRDGHGLIKFNLTSENRKNCNSRTFLQKKRSED